MDPLFAMTVAVFLGVLTGGAGVHKLAEPGRFRQTLAGYGLLPSSLTPVAARIIPAVELAVALMLFMMLLMPSVGGFGAVLAAGLFAFYGLVIAVNLLRGRRDIDCGCSWGRSGSTGEGRIHWGLVARNAVLVALALAVVLMDPVRAATWLDRINAVAGGLAFGIIWIAFDILLANHHSIRFGRAS